MVGCLGTAEDGVPTYCEIIASFQRTPPKYQEGCEAMVSALPRSSFGVPLLRVPTGGLTATFPKVCWYRAGTNTDTFASCVTVLRTLPQILSRTL